MAGLEPGEPSAFLDASLDPMLLADAGGRVVAANAALEGLLGCERGSLTGRRVVDLLPTRLRGRAELPLPERGSLLPARQSALLRADGSELPVEVALARLEGPQGPLLWARIADASAGIRAREELEELRRRHGVLLDTLAEGVLGLDAEGRITFANPAAAKLLGYRLEELRGRSEHDLLHHHRADASVYPHESCPIARSVADGTIHHATGEVFWRKDGRPFPVEYTSAPMRENGRLLGVAVVFEAIQARGGEPEGGSVARPLARRIVNDLVEQGNVDHQTMTHVGRKLAAQTPAKGLEEHLAAYRQMGLGRVEIERADGSRYAFSGQDLLERRPESRVATCSFTLGFLSEAVAHVHAGEPTLGTEIECQSRGAPRCRFIVQVKREEGLARRVKELI